MVNPLGYQTDLMVYNPGGYRFTGFPKTRLIMHILAGLGTTTPGYLLFYTA